MTVKKMNRSHRMIYVAGFLALAVVLAILLVLAGEANAQSQKENVFQRYIFRSYEKGDSGCAAA